MTDPAAAITALIAFLTFVISLVRDSRREPPQINNYFQVGSRDLHLAESTEDDESDAG